MSERAPPHPTKRPCVAGDRMGEINFIARCVREGVWYMTGKEIDIFDEMERKRLIKREFTGLYKRFRSLDKDTLATVKPLCENAAFMCVTLKMLQEDVNKNGAVSEYQNGENQWGTKKSPSVEIYNTMVKNYAAVIRQLCELLPDSGREGDALMEYLAVSGR